ncbi:7SK snRNA methylphosphate capping enzyme [Amphibalanus amphitrite]|uniref:RNA methyltransferase n=1 Tax=Amphibalanus amphitrite TaxID=1232801 RepID=A0A6A4WZ03_AMPAM|nr:7SK snRNA methylphosphate capping enzyme [Amphibalanus amphitrite]KAF0311164.1 7SK snRNA methylphosphate capping enzyme [Amphibalanus amphitrite]
MTRAARRKMRQSLRQKAGRAAGTGPKKPVSAPASTPTADPVADAAVTATDAAVVTRRRPRRRRGQGVSQPGRLLLGGTINDPLNLAELEGMDDTRSLGRTSRHYQEQRKTGKADPGDAQDAAKSAPAKPTNFPRNVSFVHANFVLESDALLETVKPEFDTVLCLSITKWIHLNFGDAGIRRFLRRVYLCLRPGGRLLLEPQPWSSYLKYKKLTPKISETFGQLQLRPDQFPELLQQLGFLPCQTVGRPRHSAAGFSRQLQLFVKPGGSQPSSDQDITAPSDTPTAPSDAPKAPSDTPAAPSDAPAAPPTNGVGSSAQHSAAAAPISETTTDSAAADAANDTAAVATTATTGVKGPAKEATHEAKTAAPVTEIAPPTSVEPEAATAVVEKPEEKVAETAAAARRRL